MGEFRREVRYVVIKLKDIDSNSQRQLSNFMEDLSIPSRDCVVVESDWPEYELVWKMIEDRMTGNRSKDGEQDRLIMALERAGSAESALRELIDECENDMKPGWEDRMTSCIERGNCVLKMREGPTV